MKVAVIGAGNMGAAIALGAARAGHRVTVSNPSRGKLDALVAADSRLEVTHDNAAAAAGADMVLFAVKPWILPEVCTSLNGMLDIGRQLMVSVAGGVSLDRFAGMLGCGEGTGKIFHVIPDTAISVGHGMTFVASRGASDEECAQVAGLFGALGAVALIEERLMDAATALSSCGIAYAYKYVQAMVQAGVQMGFRPADALAYCVATVKGAMAMLDTPGTTPQQEIDRVTTPGGMTIRGINALERAGFTAAVIDGILAPLKP